MNGLFNTNFVMGMVLGKDLPRNEALTMGLTASQFPAGNLIGPIMLKPLIDRRTEAEDRATKAEEDLANQKKGGAGALYLGNPIGGVFGGPVAYNLAFAGAAGAFGGGPNPLAGQVRDLGQQLADVQREAQRQARLLQENYEDQLARARRADQVQFQQAVDDLNANTRQRQLDLLNQQQQLDLRQQQQDARQQLLDQREAQLRAGEAALAAAAAVEP